MSDPDSDLKDRLRASIQQKAEADDASDSTESEAMHGDTDDEEDDEDDMEMDAEMPDEAEQAVQMLADAMGESAGSVMELLSPLMAEEDSKDADTELAAESESDGETEAAEATAAAETIDTDAVLEEAREVAAAAVPDDVVTEDDLDSKLDDAVAALAEETKDVLQKGAVGSTPTPAMNGSSDVSKDDLFSDSDADAEEAE
jgi:hypothetical protein